MSKESSSAATGIVNTGSIPVWDVLSCNAYLISLLPIDEVLRYVPGLGADKDLHGILRFVAAGWLLWHQQSQQQQSTRETTRELTGRGISEKRHQVALFGLLALDGASILRRWWIQQFPSRPVLEPASTHPRMTQLATQRREKLKQILQSLWPLLRLACWIQLAQAPSEGNLPHHSKLAPLHVLYAHRRWLQEQGMELWPTIVEPLLQSSRETQRWIRQWWRTW